MPKGNCFFYFSSWVPANSFNSPDKTSRSIDTKIIKEKISFVSFGGIQFEINNLSSFHNK
jgi:hypothetical protein